MSRRLVAGMAMQVAGAAATFGTGLAIAFVQGPQAQGHYGWVRSSADLLLALALFGFPQGMVHAIHQRGAAAAGLEAWCRRYAGALLALALAVPAALALSGRAAGSAGAPDGPLAPLALAALLAGSVGWVLQNLLRAFVLCKDTALRFAWVSVTPALTLLAAVAVLLAFGSQRYEWALLASGAASAALAHAGLRRWRAQPDWHAGAPMPPGLLLKDGLHAFAQSAALALQPWLTFWLLRRHGATPAQLGEFVFAAHVFQAFALPATFVAPLLFARISRFAGEGRHFPAGVLVGRVVAAAAAGGAVAAVLLPWTVTAVFGAPYAGAVPACVVLALGGPLVVANRVGVSVLFGRGRFGAAAVHAAVRATAVPAFLMLAAAAGGPAGVGAVTAAAIVWVGVEAVCAAVLVVQLRAPGRRPAADGGPPA